MAFLSLLDDRAKPKGSRDPLGFELVWTHFGRRIVGNLTTITSSIENFVVALLGFHWANELAGGTSENDRQKQVITYFLKYEQIAGYLRYFQNSKDIMGITRVSNRAENDTRRIKIGLDSEEMILSDQTGYGLWGFYSNALKDTQLVNGNYRLPTSLGTNIVKRLEAKLDKEKYYRWIKKGKPIDKEELREESTAYMLAIGDENIVDELFELLMNGNDKDGIQRNLWVLTQGVSPIPSDIGNFISVIKSQENLHPKLKERLTDIESIERVLVAINNLFSYCQLKNDIVMTDILEDLAKQQYHYDYLVPVLPPEDFPRKGKIQSILNHLRGGDHLEALKEIFQLNKDVMQQRQGAPWIEMEANGKLKVRMRYEHARLLDQSKNELMTHWDYDYFLGSFLRMAKARLGT